MATFKICVFEHQKRVDGKFPCSIKIYWKGKQAYMKTGLYVTIKQINRKTFTLRDTFVINELNSRIAKYEDLKVKKLGYNIELYSAKELAEYFKREGAPGTDSSIDFIEFAKIHCSRLDSRGKKSTADTLRTSVNAMIDFCSGREKISITEINVKFLSQFENYLHGKRTIKRMNQMGRITTTEHKGLSEVSIHDYMTDIRTLFNAAINEYNDEEREIRIKHYPFRKYKIKPAPESNKRVLTPDQIKAIRDCTPILKRSVLARDVFLLSFYLAGTNLIDFYYMDKSAYKAGRLSYCRHKTQDRRRDKAFISIKVYSEAIHLIEKYKDSEKAFKFHKMYSTPHTFLAAVDKGLKDIATLCGIEENLTSYYARFSLASIARNFCAVTKDDINLILNHVDAGLEMTDIYVEKDWSLIDSAIKKVLDYLR